MTTETDVALEFLRRVLPAQGPYSYRYRTGKTKNWMKKEFADTIEALWSGMSSNMVSDVYYSTASFKDASSPEAANVFAKKAFYLDLDIGKGHGYDDQVAAIRATLEFCQSEGLPPPGFVGSGNGVHAYWCLTDAISCDVWQRYAAGLKVACKTRGLLADGAVTADPARILRCPGTFNYKSSPPTEVFAHKLFFDPMMGPYDLDQFDGLLAYAPEQIGVIEAAPAPFVEGSAVLNAQNMLYYGSMLDHIHNVDDRDVWHKVGMAIYELGWGDVGYNMWTDWAKQSEKYNEEEQKKAWAGFSKYRETHLDNLVTPGTLAHYAKEAGWEAGVDAPAPPPTLLPFIPTPELVAAAEKDPYILYKAEVEHVGAEKNDKDCFAANSYRNVRWAMVKLDVRGRRDEFSGRSEVKIPGEPWMPRTDAVDRRIRDMILDKCSGSDQGKQVAPALDRLCDVGKFHPIRQYLLSVEKKWDKKPRLDTWLTYYLGASDTKLNGFYGAATLIAAVRRVMRDEVIKFDHMLVLEGRQGVGKSTVVETLGGPWYRNQEINWSDPRTALEVFRGCWFYEWAELSGHGRVDARRIKSCLSTGVDEGRVAFAHNPSATVRRTILIGTTNKFEAYLDDDTGNRRYWCVRCGDEKFKLDEFKRDIDQIWAEAMIREKTYPQWFSVPKELWEAEREAIEEREEPAELEDLLRHVGSNKDDCHEADIDPMNSRKGKIEYIFTDELKVKYCQELPTRWLDRKIGAAMTKLRWKSGRRYRDDKQLRCYWREK